MTITVIHVYFSIFIFHFYYLWSVCMCVSVCRLLKFLSKINCQSITYRFLFRDSTGKFQSFHAPHSAFVIGDGCLWCVVFFLIFRCLSDSRSCHSIFRFENLFDARSKENRAMTLIVAFDECTE